MRDAVAVESVGCVKSASFRVCSWNVNGLRSLRLPLKSVLDGLDADIVCLQETKTSGVAIFCRNPLKPSAVTEGFVETFDYQVENSTNGPYHSVGFLISKLGLSVDEVRSMDAEGRFIVAFFPVTSLKCLVTNSLLDRSVAVISVYLPRVHFDNTNRIPFRTGFERCLDQCIQVLLETNYVIVSGDLNVYHTSLDHSEPPTSEADQLSISSRRWLDHLLIPAQRDPGLLVPANSNQRALFVDVFRQLFPHRTHAFTCWSTRTGARETNYGTRIDYILFDQHLFNLFGADRLNADIEPDVLGSDHCPVWSSLPLTINDCSHDLPQKCSQFWPQCQTKQTKLTLFATHTPLSTPPAVPHKRASGHVLNKPVRRGLLKQSKLAVVPVKTSHEVSSVSNEPSPSNTIPRKNSEVVDMDRSGDKRDSGQIEAVTVWQRLLTGPKKAPLCRAHNEPCVLRIVKQKCTASGSRRGRRFWICARPQGAIDNPLARCGTFLWDDLYRP
ncbi:AP endonuclease 2 [Paragonimus westermani]|uniref:DNA-(apurinic or apyrimidinic site) endonuclease n=1 Tax=Paragonimus westermani TaxID=34504 RepID=A0A5J4N9N0_9TREM|nr:AP endonuclease 2 [Paragonimus westermani]